jgi:hypothetical protein
MIICPQCCGAAKTKPINESLAVPNGMTFTDITSGQNETTCNYCNGVGYFTGSGS